MNDDTPSLFDAIRIVRFPDGAEETPVYYSQTGRSHLRVGDVGVVIGQWLGNKLRVEAVDPSGAIDWQDHLAVDQVEIIPTTDAPYCCRRVNEHWSWNLIWNGGPIHQEARDNALDLARKVMAFTRQNVEILVDRLATSGYRFANGHPYAPPADDVSSQLQELSDAGVHVPIALEAWLTEVGSVDLCGSHPDWPHTAFSGMFDEDAPDEAEPWYTDPLVIQVDLAGLIKQGTEQSENLESIAISPDAVTKANISGGGPNSIACTQPSFDNVVIGQQGSYTLLSYLRHAFDWAGFPGFEYIADAPTEMLKTMAQGLVRL